MIVRDQLNRTLSFPETPKRIISLVPSQTELLVDLGLRDCIVGVTKFCVHPPDLRKEVTVVGGTKSIHLDKIAALAPDIIICNKEENTQEIVENCEKIAPVWVSDIKNIADNNEMISLLGCLLNVETTANTLVSAINARMNVFKMRHFKIKNNKVAYLIWKNPFMAAGDDTFINYLLQLIGFKNIFTEKEGRYPEITEEDLINVDTVLLSSEPYPFKDKDVIELKNALDRPVHLVDGEYFSWYGSRLLKAFNYFESFKDF